MAEQSLPPAPAGGQQPLNFGGEHGGPSFDPIALLPSAAADRLRALRQRRADAHAVIPPFEDVRLASMARVEAANTLKKLTDHPHNHGFNLPPDARQVVAAQRTLDEATAAFVRLQELAAVRTAAFQSSSQALAACEEWLRHSVPGGCTLEVMEIEPPRLLKGEDITAAIERLRRRGRELRADAHRLQSAPFPSSHCKAKMRAQIEALSLQGQPDVTGLVELDHDVIWPTKRVQSEVHGEQRALAFTETPDALAILVWLHRDALIKRLDAEIAAASDDPAALTHEARQQREAEVLGDMLAIERIEAALVQKAQAQDLPVDHRADINPLAVLGVALVTAPRATAPATSEGYAWDILNGR